MSVGDENPCASSSRLNEPDLGDREGVPGADNVKVGRNRTEHICGESKSECYKLCGGITTRGRNFPISNIMVGLVERV